MYTYKPGILFRLTKDFQYSFSVNIPKEELMLILNIDSEGICDVIFTPSKKKARFMLFALPAREFISYA